MNLIELFNYLLGLGKQTYPECQVVARVVERSLCLYFIWPNGVQVVRVINEESLEKFRGDPQFLEDSAIGFAERDYKIAEVGEE